MFYQSNRLVTEAITHTGYHTKYLQHNRNRQSLKPATFRNRREVNVDIIIISEWDQHHRRRHQHLQYYYYCCYDYYNYYHCHRVPTIIWY